MTQNPPGWYDDGTGTTRYWDGTRWTEQTQEPQPGLSGTIEHVRAVANAGAAPRPGPRYVVLQVVLKEKFFGTGSNNLIELERVINEQAALGYRLHTITMASSGSQGWGGGDRIQATMVFESVA